MNWEAIFNGALGAGVLAIILRLIDQFFARSKTSAEVANLIVQGGKTALDAAITMLDEHQEQSKELKAEIEAIKTARIEREAAHTKEIDELKARIQADMLETGKLRNDYAVAKSRIIKLEDMAIGLGEYVDVIKRALQSAEIPVPLNGALLESVMRLKADRDKRNQ